MADYMPTEAAGAEFASEVERVIVLPEELSLEDAYGKLSKSQRLFYDSLRDYALEQEGVAATRANRYENFKCGKRSVMKLQIKRGKTVAVFSLEHEGLREIRMNADEGAEIKTRPTEVVLQSAAALDTAKGMVDLVMQQIAREKDEAKRRRSEARRLERERRKKSAEA